VVRGAVSRRERSRLERALALEFEMITTGERVEHAALVDGLRESHGRTEIVAFDIEARDVEAVAPFEDHAVVRYEAGVTRNQAG
jgi:hypothetical protein